jgi:hypothetical protein
MAKKPVSIAQRLERAVSDVANAASVAATGSELGVLELAAEDELNPRPAKRARKAKRPAKRKKAAVKKKRVSATKLRKPAGRKRISKRPSR